VAAAPVLVSLFLNLSACAQTATPTPLPPLLPTPTPFPADFNEDGRVGPEDLPPVLENWGRHPPLDVITIDLPDLPSDARPLRLVRIPAGTFEMGNTGTDRESMCPPLPGFDCGDEYPRHTVTLTRDFYIGETEITQAQWESVTGPFAMRPVDELCGRMSNMPVVRVNWDDCQPFLRNLTWMTGFQFRLPTEAEWEYACRGSNRNPERYNLFYFGDNPFYDLEFGFDPYLDQYMVWGGNYRYEDPNPVMECGPKEAASRWPNDYGLYDMHGNMAEWCQDWYRPDFYSQPKATEPDPVCLDSSSGLQIRRGGAFSTGAVECRSSYRFKAPPESRQHQVGFRIVFVPE
jgi:formylglycine-generating enzyme required for sulfatase activity